MSVRQGHHTSEDISTLSERHHIREIQSVPFAQKVRPVVDSSSRVRGPNQLRDVVPRDETELDLRRIDGGMVIGHRFPFGGGRKGV